MATPAINAKWMQSALQSEEAFSVNLGGLVFGSSIYWAVKTKILRGWGACRFCSAALLWQDNSNISLRDKWHRQRANASWLLLSLFFWMFFAVYFRLYLPGFNVKYRFIFFFPQFFMFLWKLGVMLCYPMLRFRLQLLDCSTGSLPEALSSSQQGEAGTFRWKIS